MVDATVPSVLLAAVTVTFFGPKRALDPLADVTITSYTLLRMDEEILSANRARVECLPVDDYASALQTVSVIMRVTR
jgi:hypothetical protein